MLFSKDWTYLASPASLILTNNDGPSTALDSDQRVLDFKRSAALLPRSGTGEGEAFTCGDDSRLLAGQRSTLAPFPLLRSSLTSPDDPPGITSAGIFRRITSGDALPSITSQWSRHCARRCFSALFYTFTFHI